MKTLNQLLTDNPNLLSFVVVPTAQAEDLDSATLKTAIIRRCGDVAPYYQKAADFTLFGTMWFNTHSFLFAHALEVWNATYNPIENYDRHESMTRAVNSNSKGVNNSSGTMTQTDESENKIDNSNVTNTDNNGTATNGQTAYDSDTFKDTSRTISSGTSNSQNISNEKGSTKNKSNGSNVRAETSENESAGNEIVTSHIHGNIGVTQAADMLERYREVIPFCTYNYIVNSFKERFCIQVY